MEREKILRARDRDRDTFAELLKVGTAVDRLAGDVALTLADVTKHSGYHSGFLKVLINDVGRLRTDIARAQTDMNAKLDTVLEAIGALAPGE